MKPADLGRPRSVGDSPAGMREGRSSPAPRRSAARRTLDAGGRTCATEPFSVSCTTGLIGRIRPELGHHGDRCILQADRPRERHDVAAIATSIIVSSSDSRRQPRATSAGAERALARARWRRQDQRAAATLDHGGVDDQVLVAMRGNAPVQSPLEQRERLACRERLERRIGVEAKQRLRPDPSPKSAHSGRRRRENPRTGWPAQRSCAA